MGDEVRDGAEGARIIGVGFTRQDLARVGGELDVNLSQLLSPSPSGDDEDLLAVEVLDNGGVISESDGVVWKTGTETGAREESQLRSRVDVAHCSHTHYRDACD